MREGVLAGIERGRTDQRFGKGSGARRLIDGSLRIDVRRPVVEQLDDGRSGLRHAAVVRLHGASRNSRTTATCSPATKVGAWPTPANSWRRARGPRSTIACAVCGV